MTGKVGSDNMLGPLTTHDIVKENEEMAKNLSFD